MYTGANYTLLEGSGTNSTHWYASVLCQGCSQWKGGSVNPANTAAPLAWAASSKPVAKPSDPSSSFSIHDSKAQFKFDLTAAKATGFEAAIKPLTPSSKSQAPSS